MYWAHSHLPLLGGFSTHNSKSVLFNLWIFLPPNQRMEFSDAHQISKRNAKCGNVIVSKLGQVRQSECVWDYKHIASLKVWKCEIVEVWKNDSNVTLGLPTAFFQIPTCECKCRPPRPPAYSTRVWVFAWGLKANMSKKSFKFFILFRCWKKKLSYGQDPASLKPLFPTAAGQALERVSFLTLLSIVVFRNSKFPNSKFPKKIYISVMGGASLLWNHSFPQQLIRHSSINGAGNTQPKVVQAMKNT